MAIDESTADSTETCDYCESSDLAYELQTGRGSVVRCLSCLAIEQGQQSCQLPLDAYDGLDDELLVHSWEKAADWFRILARLTHDEPLIERDPDVTITVGESTREFLTNIMGSDAHYPPSDVAGREVAVAQSTFSNKGDADD